VISSSVLPISRAPKLTPFLPPPSTYREPKNCEKEEENDKWLQKGRQKMKVRKAGVSSILSLKGRKRNHSWG
jgi:hypothetical protein